MAKAHIRSSRRLASLFIVLLVAVCWLSASAAKAHDGRPISFEATASDTGELGIALRVPDAIPRDHLPTPHLPEQCELVDIQPIAKRSDVFAYGHTYRCEEIGSGLELGLDFPTYNPSLSTFFSMKFAGGEQVQRLLPPGETRWQTGTQSSAFSVAAQYGWLGILHILMGFDHLLFVLCLLVIAGSFKRILIVITGFTIAHSITLSLSVMGIVRVSNIAVETVIALSIVLLAAEIIRGRRDTILWRRPVLIACGFGLLHGFGFASVLGELGLPQLYTAQALFFFNFGVELGQIAFILTVLAIARIVAALTKIDLTNAVEQRATKPAFYLIGIVAAVWCFERAHSAFV